MLNRVCMLAIWLGIFSGEKDATNAGSGNSMHTMVKMMVPVMLNIRWIRVVRLALRLVPMLASTAVMQVPMF